MAYVDPIEDHDRPGNRYPQSTASAISEANAAIDDYEAAVVVAEEKLAYAKVLIGEATAIATTNEETEDLPAVYDTVATDHIQVLPGNVSFIAGDADAEKIWIQPSAPATTGVDGEIWIDNDADPIAAWELDTAAWEALAQGA